MGHGSAATRGSLRRRLLEVNPFYWLAARDRMKVVLVWTFLGGGGCCGRGASGNIRPDWKDAVAYVWTGLIAHTALKCWLTMEACRRFSAIEKRGRWNCYFPRP